MTLQYNSPIGIVNIEYSEKGMSKLVFTDEAEGEERSAGFRDSPFSTQIDEYFSGIRKIFDLPLDLQGTDFQKRVWLELLKIPYGKTISYKELAIKLGDLKAIRAVAAANGTNPVSIEVLVREKHIELFHSFIILKLPFQNRLFDLGGCPPVYVSEIAKGIIIFN